MIASIVIPAYNEEATIEKCISSLFDQSFKKFEIIVVDDGSTDKTMEMLNRLVEKDKRLKVIKGEHKGPGFSRNLGAGKTRGKILVFVDADMTFDRDYLKSLIEPILSGETIGTEDGKQIASNPENIWSRCWGNYFKDYLNPNKGQIFRALLKSEFERMGGFDSSLGYADDLTFYLKYGVNSLRVPSAICYHKNPESLKEVYGQSKWIGASLDNEKGFLKKWLVREFFLLSAFIFSPLLIIYLSLKKSYKNQEMKLFFPWMVIFITARYFGTLEGIIKKAYFKNNKR